MLTLCFPSPAGTHMAGPNHLHSLWTFAGCKASDKEGKRSRGIHGRTTSAWEDGFGSSSEQLDFLTESKPDSTHIELMWSLAPNVCA